MESLKRALFEDPFYLYATLVFVALAMAGVWHARRSRAWLVALAVTVLLAAAVFVTEKLVVTDREQIRRALTEIARHIEAANLDGVWEYLDEDLSGAYGDRDDAVESGRNTLRVYKIKSLRYVNPRVSVQGDRAEVRVTTVIDFEVRGTGGGTALKWRLGWVKRPGGWRIREVDRPQQGVDFGSP